MMPMMQSRTVTDCSSMMSLTSAPANSDTRGPYCENTFALISSASPSIFGATVALTSFPMLSMNVVTSAMANLSLLDLRRLLDLRQRDADVANLHGGLDRRLDVQDVLGL